MEKKGKNKANKKTEEVEDVEDVSDSEKPGPPKKPLSAYFLFAADVRPKVVKENPEEKVSQIAKIIGELWSEQTDSQKKPYQEKQAKLKANYEEEMKQYTKKYGVPKKKERKKKKMMKDESQSEEEKPQKKKKSKKEESVKVQVKKKGK